MASYANSVVVRGAALLVGVDPRSLVACDRRRELVDGRAAAAVALRRLGWPLDAIGVALGGRRASTIHHALIRVSRPGVAAHAAALEILATSLAAKG